MLKAICVYLLHGSQMECQAQIRKQTRIIGIQNKCTTKQRVRLYGIISTFQHESPQVAKRANMHWLHV